MAERGYLIQTQSRSESAYVDTGRELYLVISTFKDAWKTYVFLHILHPDTWILRREVDGHLDPDKAVTGTVLAQENHLIHDPILDLKNALRRMEDGYHRLLNEKLHGKGERRLTHGKKRGR